MPLNGVAVCGLAVAVAVALAGCTAGPFARDDTRGADNTPVIDRASVSAALIAGYLEVLQNLVQSAPAEQAEIFVATQREFELAPTPSHQLRYALALATPGHAATDLTAAQRLLRELLALPETLLPAERALAFLELQRVNHQLTLVAENRTLQANAARADRERLAAMSRRLQAEIDANAQLRKELAEARAKLDAIANIERSLSNRKPNAEGRTP